MNRGGNQFENFECTFTVTDAQNNYVTLKETVVAPRFVHEQYFKQLVMQFAQLKQHYIVKISRYQYVEGRDDPLNLYIEFRNWQENE